jgi:hypothetical protein
MWWWIVIAVFTVIASYQSSMEMGWSGGAGVY